MPSFLAPLLDGSGSRYLLRNDRTNCALATRLDAAFDSRRRRRGLLDRTHLDPGAAMILAPCAAVHTFFMRFAIDVVFVRRNGTVEKVVANVKPWRIAVAPRAFAVIEVSSGAAAGSGTMRGDRLRVESLESHPGETPLAAFYS